MRFRSENPSGLSPRFIDLGGTAEEAAEKLAVCVAAPEGVMMSQSLTLCLKA